LWVYAFQRLYTISEQGASPLITGSILPSMMNFIKTQVTLLLIVCLSTITQLSQAQTDGTPLQEQLIKLEQYRQSGPSEDLNHVLLQVGYLYWNQGESEKAIPYFKESAGINNTIGNVKGESQAYQNIGIIYGELRNYEQSIAYLRKAEVLMEKNRDKRGLSATLLHLGVNQFHAQQHEQATASLEKCLKIATELSAVHEITDSYLYLSKSYEALGEREKALGYHKKYTQGFKFEGSQQLAALSEEYDREKQNLKDKNKEANLEIEKKEKELELLRLREREAAALAKARQSEIALLKKEKELQHARLKEQEAQLEADRIKIIASITCAALGGLLALVLVIAYIQKNKVNKTLQKQKREIEKKSIQLQMQNEKILASEESIKTKNKELEESNRKLIELHQEINYLSGIVVNDLKGPLSHVEDLVEMIYENIPQLSKAQQEYVNSIVESTKHLKALILDLEEVEALRSENVVPNFEQVDLRQAVSGLLTRKVKQEIGSKQIKIVTDFAQEVSPVSVDREFLEIIIRNLVSNAVKYSYPSSNIYVSIFQKDGKVLTEVRDEGVGISEADQQKLFKKFETFTAQPTSGEPSTGLGLALVKQYSELMNGRVWCQSKKGEGSSFFVEFNAMGDVTMA